MKESTPLILMGTGLTALGVFARASSVIEVAMIILVIGLSKLWAGK